MKIEDLATLALDFNLGTPWTPNLWDELPDWRVGRRWRVEYAFRVPALSLHALALGDEVRAVYRYEVLREEVRDREDAVVLRISPERRGGAGFHYIAVYRKRDRALLEAKRFQGEVERPFEARKLPELDQVVRRGDDGAVAERELRTPPPAEPAAPAAAPEDEADALAAAAFRDMDRPAPVHPEEADDDEDDLDEELAALGGESGAPP